VDGEQVVEVGVQVAAGGWAGVDADVLAGAGQPAGQGGAERFFGLLDDVGDEGQVRRSTCGRGRPR
jgi:hypothetical protein